MTDQVEVSLGAKTDPATNAVEAAASSIDASLQRIADALAKFTEQNKKAQHDSKAATDGIAAQFKALQSSINNSIESITGTFDKLHRASGAILAILGGGGLFREAIGSMVSLEHEVNNLEQAMGMGSEQATHYAIALKLLGKDSTDLTSMAFRVSMQIKNNADEFDRLGVKVRDANGDFLPMIDILKNTYERMQDFKAGADQNMFALATVGRSARDFADTMEKLGEVDRRATQLQHEMNIEMGPEKAANIRAYKVEMAALKIVFEQVSEAGAERLLPTLKSTAEWFADRGPQVVAFFGDAFKGMLSAIEYGGAIFASIMIEFGRLAEEMRIRVVSSWKAVKLAAQFNFTGAYNAIAQANRDIIRNNNNAADAVMAAWDKAGITIAKIWAERKTPNSPDVKPPPDPNKGLSFPVKSGADKSRVAEWEAELKARQDAYNQEKLDQGSFETWSVQQTIAYWEKIKATTALTTDELREVNNRYYDARRQMMTRDFTAYIADLEQQKQAAKFNSDERIAIAQQEFQAIAQRYGALSAEAKEAQRRVTEEYQKAAEQRQRIADIEQKSQLATSKNAIEMRRLELDQQAALQQISVQQRLAAERNFVLAERDIDEQAVRDRIAIMEQDPNSDPVKLAELKAQLLAIEQNYQKQLTQIDNQATLDRKQFALQALDDIKSAMSDLLASLTDQSKTFAQKLKAIGDQLLAQLSKIAANQVIKEYFGPSTSGGNFLSGITDRIFGKGAFGAAGGDTGGAALQAAGSTLQAAGTTLGTAAGPFGVATPIFQTAVTQFQAAVSQWQASLATQGGGGLGGVTDLFGNTTFGNSFFDSSGAGVGFGVGFAAGTPYVPQDMLAIVHKGEAIVPAQYNKGDGVGSHSYVVNQTIQVQGAADTRSMAQIRAAAAQGVRMGAQRGMSR